MIYKVKISSDLIEDVLTEGNQIMEGKITMGLPRGSKLFDARIMQAPSPAGTEGDLWLELLFDYKKGKVGVVKEQEIEMRHEIPEDAQAEAEAAAAQAEAEAQ